MNVHLKNKILKDWFQILIMKVQIIKDIIKYLLPIVKLIELDLTHCLIITSWYVIFYLGSENDEESGFGLWFLITVLKSVIYWGLKYIGRFFWVHIIYIFVKAKLISFYFQHDTTHVWFQILLVLKKMLNHINILKERRKHDETSGTTVKIR